MNTGFAISHVITRFMRVIQPNTYPQLMTFDLGMDGPAKPGHDVD